MYIYINVYVYVYTMNSDLGSQCVYGLVSISKKISNEYLYIYENKEPTKPPAKLLFPAHLAGFRAHHLHILPDREG